MAVFVELHNTGDPTVGPEVQAVLEHIAQSVSPQFTGLLMRRDSLMIAEDFIATLQSLAKWSLSREISLC